MSQQSFSDMEYSLRKRTTKREEFLDIMDEIIPWDEWVDLIKPHYFSGKRGRPPKGIEKMLRIYLLQCWFRPCLKNKPQLCYFNKTMIAAI
jgi:IS5 family transposase